MTSSFKKKMGYVLEFTYSSKQMLTKIKQLDEMPCAAAAPHTWHDKLQGRNMVLK